MGLMTIKYLLEDLSLGKEEFRESLPLPPAFVNFQMHTAQSNQYAKVV